ncbi:MAG: LPS export ABC transporter permease LptF [Pseudomonadota bacterium]|nr:LPS export ABC transporter permease LptF [Pseudomonadota bacterium]
MRHLHNYIFRQLVWWALLVATTLTCIVWLTQSLRFVDMIVNRGLSVTTFVSFTLLLLPTFLSFIGPIALFVAVVFTYQRMLNDSEIIVLGAIGLSPSNIARPALILGVFLTALGYLNTLYLVPTAFREFKDLQREYRTDFAAVFLQAGVFNPVVKGVTVFIRERSNWGELYGIIVHDERKPENPLTFMAEKGVIVAGDRGPRVLMINGNRQEVAADDGRLSLLYFEKYTFDLKDLNKTDINVWREPRERFLHELIFRKDQAKTGNDITNYQKLRMEGIFRLSAPLLYVAFCAIALSLLLGGGFNRRSQFLKILIAVGSVLILQIGMLGLKNLGEKIPQIAPLMYLLPILVTAFFLLLLKFIRKRIPNNRQDFAEEAQ